MNYVLIANDDGTSSLVHADEDGVYLAHHGIKGQRWGVRRFQNPDGSLKPAGVKRMNTLQGKSEKLQKKKDKLNTVKKQNKLSSYRSISKDYHTKANAAKADEDFYKNKSEYAWTNHGTKVAARKATKAHNVYVKNAKRAVKYDKYITQQENANAKIDRKKLKIDTKFNELNDVYKKYGQSLVEKKKK